MVRGTHPTFVLLHSPLVGPVSWDAVRRAFYQRAYPVSVPTITSDAPPYWRGYVDRAAEAITDTAADEVVLVAHSGAGALIAAIVDMAVPEVSGIVFVDATLPADGRTRLEEMEAFDPAFAVALRTGLDRGGRYPDWTDATLTEQIRLVLAQRGPAGGVPRRHAPTGAGLLRGTDPCAELAGAAVWLPAAVAIV